MFSKDVTETLTILVKEIIKTCPCSDPIQQQGKTHMNLKNRYVVQP